MSTLEKIITLASDAGFDITEPDGYHDSSEVLDSGNLWITERITAFYHAVRSQALEDAVAKCEFIFNDPAGNSGYDSYYTRPYLECAGAIRQMKEEPK